MPSHQDADKLRERSLLLTLLAILFFASPLTLWWASSGSPWFLPYLLWLLIILFGALLHLRYGRHDL